MHVEKERELAADARGKARIRKKKHKQNWPQIYTDEYGYSQKTVSSYPREQFSLTIESSLVSPSGCFLYLCKSVFICGVFTSLDPRFSA